jgi:hypothetical protein
VDIYKIIPEKFKQFIKSKVPLSSITIKSKNANSAFDVKGIKIIGSNGVNLENKVIEVKTEKIDLELNEDAFKKKKIVNKKVYNIIFLFKDFNDINTNHPITCPNQYLCVNFQLKICNDIFHVFLVL